MKKIIITLITIIITSCVENSDKLPEIKFDDFSIINLKHEIPLDSVVERTEIIRFVSDSNLIIGKIKDVYESKTNFFVIENNRILRFDKKGKFINFIGNKGKGPGEFISPWAIDVDDTNQHIYVIDYFGRKMVRYHFDGSFVEKYSLPESFSINGFRLYHNKILYTSNANSVIPELYLYNYKSDELSELSSPNREMLAGEGMLGSSFITGSREQPLFFHYFNDTVYSIKDETLQPQHLLKLGNLKIKFDELIVESDKRPNGARAQLYNFIQGENFTFISYGVTRLNNKRQQTQITGFYKNDLSTYSPCTNFINNRRAIENIHTGQKISAGYKNSLLRTITAFEVLKIEPDFNISEDDNPILIKYHLK